MTRYYKRNIIIILVALTILGLFLLVNMAAKDTAMEIARSRAQLRGQEIISRAVEEKVGSNEYLNLVIVHKDNEGRVVLLQPNTSKINRLMARTLLAIEKDLINLEKEEFSIPLGRVLGNSIFSGFGPGIKVKMMPVGKIKINLIDRFEGAGINQTRYLICLEVCGTINVVAPFSREEVKVSVTVPVAETIIVGQVPTTYVQLNGKGEVFSSRDK